MSNRLLERGIITETVSITNFKFSDTFTATIEAKIEAQQAAAQAKGEADARIARATGEAEYIRVVTEAQVAANEAIANSLTPEVLQYILFDRLGDDIEVMVIPSDHGLDLALPQLHP